jgi:hypothetical protein
MHLHPGIAAAGQLTAQQSGDVLAAACNGTTRFFSESYLRHLLHGWPAVSLEPVRIDDSAGSTLQARLAHHRHPLSLS